MRPREGARVKSLRVEEQLSFLFDKIRDLFTIVGSGSTFKRRVLMELPLEIVTGVRERQKAIEAAEKEVAAAANVSFEADRAYYEAEHPPGIRGDYLIPLCRLVESKLKIWPVFIGGDRKELRKLETEKKEKLSAWKQKTAEKNQLEINLDDFIGRYLESLDPGFKDLLGQFSAADKLFEAVDFFETRFFEAAHTMNGPINEMSKSALKQQLVKLSFDFPTVQKTVMSYLPGISESESDLKGKLSKVYKDLTDVLGKAKNPERTYEVYEDFSQLNDPVMELRQLVWDYRESLDEKIRAQVDSVKTECFK